MNLPKDHKQAIIQLTINLEWSEGPLPFPRWLLNKIKYFYFLFHPRHLSWEINVSGTWAQHPAVYHIVAGVTSKSWLISPVLKVHICPGWNELLSYLCCFLLSISLLVFPGTEHGFALVYSVWKKMNLEGSEWIKKVAWTTDTGRLPSQHYVKWSSMVAVGHLWRDADESGDEFLFDALNLTSNYRSASRTLHPWSLSLRVQSCGTMTSFKTALRFLPQSACLCGWGSHLSDPSMGRCVHTHSL